MGNDKITVSFRVDKAIWDVAKYRLPCTRSKYLEDCLRRAIYTSNEIESLEREIEKITQDLNAKHEKLEKLKEFNEKNSSNIDSINEAMKTVFKIVFAHDYISEAQIIHIAKSNFINPDVLREHIKNNDIKITEYTAEEKETTVKKSKTIYDSR